MSWMENFLKNNKQEGGGGAGSIKDLRVFKYENDHYGTLESNFPTISGMNQPYILFHYLYIPLRGSNA